MTPNINNSIGCSNCHEAGTMRLIVTNPALKEALAAQGKDWETFTRQEMRTVVCANCHVEYYFRVMESILLSRGQTEQILTASWLTTKNLVSRIGRTQIPIPPCSRRNTRNLNSLQPIAPITMPASDVRIIATCHTSATAQPSIHRTMFTARC